MEIERAIRIIQPSTRNEELKLYASDCHMREAVTVQAAETMAEFAGQVMDFLRGAGFRDFDTFLAAQDQVKRTCENCGNEYAPCPVHIACVNKSNWTPAPPVKVTEAV